MTLPAGVTTCAVTWSAPPDSLGTPGHWLSVKIKADRKLVWAATGTTLYDQATDVTPAWGSDFSTPVAHVDQSGFTDASGAAVTGWSYTANGQAVFRDGSRKWYRKTFQVVTGQTTVDLDSVPDGAATAAVTAPTASVVSVAGLAGVVSADGLATAMASTITSAVDVTASRRAFYDYFGAGLLAWEDAQRPDIANFSQFTEGYAAKSGHPVTSDGAVNTNSILSISGHRMRWTDGTPGGTPIRIAKMILNQEPTRIGALAAFSTETTTLDTWNPAAASNSHVGANGPIGACAVSYAQGSVQLALYRHGLMLFVVENPLVDPYYSPWSIAFASRIPDDDQTPVAYYMDFDRPSSTITVHCPAKMDPVSITDPKFATYWGSTFGWQERRSAATDARVSYLAVGAGV